MPSRVRATIMNDLCVRRVVSGRAFPAAAVCASPNPVRAARLSAVRSQSDDLSMYENLHMLGVSSPSVSPPSRKAHSLALDPDCLSELSQGTLDNLLRPAPMPHRPKFISVPNGRTVPAPISAGGRGQVGTRSLCPDAQSVSVR